MKKTLKYGPISFLFAALLFISACGGGSTGASTAAQADGQKADNSAAVRQNGQKVLRVGTSGRSLPMSYQNEQGNLDGFDIEVMTAIADKLGLTIEWTTAEFSGLFGMLDADKIDTIANQVEISEERQQKYLFTTPYVYSGSQLVVKKGNDSIHSLDDLAGKKIAVGLGTNKEKFLREYAAEHRVDMNIVTYEDPSGIVYDVANGRVDAYIVDRASGLIKIEKSGLDLEFAGESFEDYIIAYPFVNNSQNKELVEQFNMAIEQMHQDGTLAELSLKHLKQDVSKQK